MSSYYPVYLNLAAKRCVIFGGGTVAEGKLAALQDAGACVTVISPDATPGIRQLAQEGKLEWQQRRYEAGDLDGAFLAIAATNVKAVNKQIFDEANRRGVILNVVDDTPLCTFIAPAIVKKGPVTLAISTGGASPALARKLRVGLAEAPALDWVELADILSQARSEVRKRKAQVDPQRWQCCLTPDLLELAQAGKPDEARARFLAKLLDGATPGLCSNLGQCDPAGCPNRPRE